MAAGNIVNCTNYIKIQPVDQLGKQIERQNLCFRSLPLQCDIVQYHHATPEVSMSTSGLVPTILDSPLPVCRDDIILGLIITGDPENRGFAAETAILAAQQD
jgi:hypothetical protein